MKKVLLGSLLFWVILFTSCQKEIDWGNGGGGGGSTSGDLLIKALEITPATNDTNIVTAQWDANKRLLVYKSAGKVNGTATDIIHTITRLSNGKISKIASKSSLAAGFIDSIVYIPIYQVGSFRLSYVIDTQFTLLGPIIDSSIYGYDAAGMVTSKETFTDFFGIVIPSAKEVYTYDASGNVITLNIYSSNGSGGYDLAASHTYTYDLHKNAVILAEESYIVLGAENVSKNNVTKLVSNNIAGGATYTSTFSQQLFNSFDRPTQALLSVTPQPPGYDVNFFYYYQ